MCENKIRKRLAAVFIFISARMIMVDCKNLLDVDDPDVVLGKQTAMIMSPSFVLTVLHGNKKWKQQ